MKLLSTEARASLLTALIESSEDAIISKGLDSRITSWNAAAERLFGYTEEEMLGELVHKLIPPERLGEEEDIISRLKNGERVEHFETVRINKEGQQLQVSLTISPIKDDTGKVIGASKIARDISRQKQTEERLQLINEFAKSINSQLDVHGILQLVTDTCTRLCNASFGAFFYNTIDDKGKAYQLYTLSGAPREAFDKFGMPRNTAVFNETFSGSSIVRSDDITKDPRYGHNSPHKGMPKGHLPVCSYLAAPVISPSGVVIGGLFLGHPSAAQFNSEHEVLIAALAAQAAIALDNAKLYEEVSVLNKKKDQFISFASHELKTPLTILKGYLELAESNAISLPDFYKRMHTQVNRLQHIIGDLLDISKIHAGIMEFSLNHHSLLQLIREGLQSVEAKEREVQLELPAEPVMLYCDASKVVLVLVNLLSNALKYSADDTPIRIAAEVLGDNVQVCVQDYGIGIPKSKLDAVFMQYYRSSEGKLQAQGMGLGLFIAKEMVEAHHGRIWVESEEGKGSCFCFSIPMEYVRKEA